MNFLLLQTQPSPYGNLIFLALLFGVFWFFLIRPQSKRQKEQRLFAESIQKGDEVVTSGGIIGRVNKIEGQIVTLEVGNKTYIRVPQSVISKEMTEAVLRNKGEEKNK